MRKSVAVITMLAVFFGLLAFMLYRSTGEAIGFPDVPHSDDAVLATSPVSITDQGFVPSVVTITVGNAIEWTNLRTEAVHLMSGEPHRVYLPVVLRGGSAPVFLKTEPVAPYVAPWLDALLEPGAVLSHTFSMAGDYPYFLANDPLVAGRVIVQVGADLPCLTVVGQHQPPDRPLPPVYAGCASNISRVITWHYDYRGAFIGFDLRIPAFGAPTYRASIDIERAASGRIDGYNGKVDGVGFPEFTEVVTNTYNPQGGLIGAQVSKHYTDAPQENLMEITKYCPHPAMDLIGYGVNIQGQEVSVGVCP